MSENGHRPSYLIESGETDVIPIPGTDATVTMKREATWDDELAVEAAMPPGIERHVFYRLYSQARAVVMIESWTLKDADGSPLPINEEVLAHRLSRRVASFIDKEAKKRYNGGTGEREANFASASEPSSEATRQTTQKR